MYLVYCIHPDRFEYIPSLIIKSIRGAWVNDSRNLSISYRSQRLPRELRRVKEKNKNKKKKTKTKTPPTIDCPLPPLLTRNGAHIRVWDGPLGSLAPVPDVLARAAIRVIRHSCSPGEFVNYPLSFSPVISCSGSGWETSAPRAKRACVLSGQKERLQCAMHIAASLEAHPRHVAINQSITMAGGLSISIVRRWTITKSTPTHPREKRTCRKRESHGFSIKHTNIQTRRRVQTNLTNLGPLPP
jgi:hypothetical protein